MRKFLIISLISILAFFATPDFSLAAGGIFASGGGSKTVGQTFTVTVAASGATFDTVHGTISISGPVSVVSFSAGSATWIAAPTNGGTFDGAWLGQKQTSATIATIKLKATGVGSGAVTVSDVALKNAGSVVGSSGGSASYTISKALSVPGAIEVSSATHPDQNTAYEATKVDLSWVKASGVTAFSYLFDDAADTTPPATSTGSGTTASYDNLTVGTHYFHIRAQNADGWGSTTHFKVNVKTPDPKIDNTLDKPNDIKIEKSDNYTNDVALGTVSGLKISGKTLAGYTAKITLTPAPTLPEGKKLEALADENGNFELILDYPIVAGFHKLTVQGQKDLVLTPLSDEIVFEISQAKGGKINILTSDDANAPANVLANASNNWSKNKIITISAIALILVLAGVLIFLKIRRKKKIKIN